MKLKNQPRPLNQRMMIKRTILISAAVLFVGITTFTAFAQTSDEAPKKVEMKPAMETNANKGLYFNTIDMNEGTKCNSGETKCGDAKCGDTKCGDTKCGDGGDNGNCKQIKEKDDC
jgi:hypothetical protein